MKAVKILFQGKCYYLDTVVRMKFASYDFHLVRIKKFSSLN